MGLQFGNLVDAALEENNEVDHSWFGQSFVERSVNDAIYQITEMADWLRGETTITLVEAQKVYSLPSDLIRVLDVKDSDEDDVKNLPLVERDHYGIQDSPFKYDTRPASDGQSRELLVFPDPESGDDGNQWTIRYLKRHATGESDELSADADAVPLPVEARYHILDWVNYRIQRRDQEQTATLDLQQWQQNTLATMRRLRKKGERGAQLIDHIARTRKHYRENY